jgi:hypothetical protein
MWIPPLWDPTFYIVEFSLKVAYFYAKFSTV